MHSGKEHGGGLVAELCPTLCEPVNCGPPGCSVHGISQARALEWAPSFFSRGSRPLGGGPGSPALAGRFFPPVPPGRPGGTASVCSPGGDLSGNWTSPHLGPVSPSLQAFEKTRLCCYNPPELWSLELPEAPVFVGMCFCGVNR